MPLYLFQYLVSTYCTLLMPNIKVEIVCIDLVYNRYQIARNCTSGVTIVKYNIRFPL